MQNLVVVVIVVAALAFVLRHSYKLLAQGETSAKCEACAVHKISEKGKGAG